MSFSVLWLPEAEQELARIWMEATDRLAVRNAADILDRRLSSHPNDVGESRSGGRRIAFEKPLIIVFKIDPRAQTVEVQRVRDY